MGIQERRFERGAPRGTLLDRIRQARTALKEGQRQDTLVARIEPRPESITIDVIAPTELVVIRQAAQESNANVFIVEGGRETPIHLLTNPEKVRGVAEIIVAGPTDGLVAAIEKSADQ